MLKIIILILLFSFNSFAKNLCKDLYVKEAAIYVSDLFQTRGYYNDDIIKLAYKNNELKAQDAVGYIPRKSLVTLDFDPTKRNLKTSDAVKARLINSNNQAVENDEDKILFQVNSRKSVLDRMSAGNNRYVRNAIKSLPSVKEGEEVYLRYGDLQRASEYKFYLKVDSMAHYFPSLKNLEGVYALRLKQNDKGEFKVKSCCEDLPFPQRKCVVRPFFEVLHSNKAVEIDFNESTNACIDNMMSHLSVFSNEIATDLEGLAKIVQKSSGLNGFKVTDFDTMDWRGFVKFPMIEGEVGPYGSYHYKPEDKENSDLYIKPNAACSFAQALKTFKRSCEEKLMAEKIKNNPKINPILFGPTTGECEVQFGDMYHPYSKGVHKDHDDGECLDIRPMRNKPGRYPGVTYKTRDYDREKTAALLQTLSDLGGSPIIFNDYKIPDRRGVFTIGESGTCYDSKGKVSTCPHSNHIHVCFKSKMPNGEPNQKVLDSCTNFSEPLQPFVR